MSLRKPFFLILPFAYIGYNFSTSGRGVGAVIGNDVPRDFDTVIAFVSDFRIPVPRQ